ncbi:MAG: 3-oxoacyl-ACP reductase FabG [Bacteroidetes bacterium]|uniref:3-oxoacyl-ACP reductase FabG n=1 Tax=Candidatus Cryptobacteroides intestinigallinarum TaxID=2840767 RepID=A0A9D9N110_9BACT|nr:3-oxoacyl-ACP reductase FabG [Candidatus Cryptobacteroides intestinigallinarum]
MEGKDTKYALVTGGSRGIGRAVCLKLASMGFNILINYRSNDEEAAKVLDAIRQVGREGELMKFDVADREAVETALSAWKSSHPDDYVSVLVNNAGLRRDSLLIWMEDSDWNAVTDVTLKGFLNVTRFLLKDMLVSRYGRIINITSLSGIKGLPGQTNYSAAKGGLIAATKALAQETARKKVTVNAVAPGFIATDMTKDLDEAELRKQIPAGRFGKPEEVAAAVGFLASEEAGYITGEVISVNGGLYT